MNTLDDLPNPDLSNFDLQDGDYDDESLGFKPWLVCLSAALFFFYEFIQMNVIDAINVELMATFSLSATGLGLFSSVYFYATVFFLLPAAMILDRMSTRRLILVALSVCIVGNLLFAASATVWMAAFSRFLTGIGSAFCFLSCIRLASRWFPPARMALVSGLIVMLAMTGGMVAQAPMTYLTQMYGWRHAMFLDGLFGFVILAWIWYFVEDYPSDQHQLEEEKKDALEALGYFNSLKKSFFRKQNWLCGLYTCMLNLPIYLLGGFMGNPYLVQIQGYTRGDAALAITALFFGATVGSPLLGWLSDSMGLRREPMMIGAVLSIIVILAIMFAGHVSVSTMSLLFFSLGVVTSSQVISYPTVAESSPHMLTATSVSVVSITVISSGAIFQPLFGKLIDMHHGGATNGSYSAADIQFAMWILPVCFLIGLVLAYIIKETYCQATDQAWQDLHE